MIACEVIWGENSFAQQNRRWLGKTSKMFMKEFLLMFTWMFGKITKRGNLTRVTCWGGHCHEETHSDFFVSLVTWTCTPNRMEIFVFVTMQLFTSDKQPVFSPSFPYECLFICSRHLPVLSLFTAKACRKSWGVCLSSGGIQDLQTLQFWFNIIQKYVFVWSVLIRNDLAKTRSWDIVADSDCGFMSNE